MSVKIGIIRLRKGAALTVFFFFNSVVYRSFAWQLTQTDRHSIFQREQWPRVSVCVLAQSEREMMEKKCRKVFNLGSVRFTAAASLSCQSLSNAVRTPPLPYHSHQSVYSTKPFPKYAPFDGITINGNALTTIILIYYERIIKYLYI